MLWQHSFREGKAAVGGYTGVVIDEPHYVPTVLEKNGMVEWMNGMKDAVPLRDFLHYDAMNASQLQMVMSDVMCYLVLCFVCFFFLWNVSYCFNEQAFLAGGASFSSSSFSSSSSSFTAMWLLELFPFLECSLGPFFCPPLRYFFLVITAAWLSH